MPRIKPAPSREQLIKVATRLFATQGFQRTTLRTIADKAGVNQGMIHYYWKTKIALYEEVYARVLGDFGSMVDESDIELRELNMKTRKGGEKMARLIVQEAVKLIDRQPFISLIVARHMIGDVPGTEHLTAKYARPLVDRYAQLLRTFMAEGYIRRQNLKMLVVSICFIFIGYHMGGGPYFFPEENFSKNPQSREKLAAHVELLLSGVMLP